MYRGLVGTWLETLTWHSYQWTQERDLVKVGFHAFSNYSRMKC